MVAEFIDLLPIPIFGKSYNKLMRKKILIVHFRTGERDGVSLDIEKRRETLNNLGHKTVLVTGYDPRSRNSEDIIKIPELDIKRRLASVLRESFFYKKILDDSIAWLIFHSEEEKIYKQFLKIVKKEKPDLIFVHNLFSIGYHLPATTAVIKVLDRLRIPTACVHHDFWWERNLFGRTKYDFIRDILESLPPKKDYIISQQVINSLAKQRLIYRSKINAEQIGDFIDFEKKQPEKDDFNQDFLSAFGIAESDLVILHSTRIVERKAIENAIVFVSLLAKKMGKKTHLLLPNFIEVESQEYFKKLKSLAEELGVNFVWLGDRISLTRQQKNGRKIYSFWDCYIFADLMTYTSVAEGFGNQLLEAFWAKIIPVVFEYPVFKSDIKKEGYMYISLDDKVRRRNGFYFIDKEKILKAVWHAIGYLKDRRLYQTSAEKNFEIAKKHHDVKFLKENLKKILKLVS